jgi:hypothetical protein
LAKENWQTRGKAKSEVDQRDKKQRSKRATGNMSEKKSGMRKEE